MSISTQETRAPSVRTDLAPVSTGRARRVLWRATIGLVIVIGLVWIGLRVQPAPFQSPDVGAALPDRAVPLPDGLPEPVERFYRSTYGDEVPVVDSAVVTGRGTMRVNGITLPVRFRFSHLSGQDYRHYIEATLYGVPALKINEWFTDGKGRLELPFGVSEGEKIDQGGNLALWAEGVFMPSIWLTDARVRWEPVDETTARLIVPFGDDTETFTVHFDASTGMLHRMESMRFKSQDAEAKTRWINEVLEWGELDGRPVPVATALTWEDEGSPWARLQTEEILYNADLTTYIRGTGP